MYKLAIARVLGILLLLLSVSCGRPSIDSEPVVVSAAVSLKDAFVEIGAIYEQGSGRDLSFNFGSSGVLQKQIETGAPADVFASAGTLQMDALMHGGLIDSETRTDVVRNQLVVVVPAGAAENVTELKQLANVGITRIAVGNPKTVPAGQYAEQALQSSGLAETLRSKLVFGEDARQVTEYVVRGEVDAGIVYATDSKIAGDRVRAAFAIPSDLHDPIIYPAAVVKTSRHPDAAAAFIELVRSSAGRDILQRHGFIVD